MPRAPVLSFAWCAFALSACALVLCACGRKATDADCSFILDRNVEVQMKALHITDPASVAKRKTEVHDELKGELQGCIGKRITDEMLACVARAQAADEIDKCMR